MKYYHVSYATSEFESRQDNIPTMLNGAGIDKFYMYSSIDIEDSFILENYDVLSNKRGAGYWLWKPYFILKTLNECEYDDVVIYSDCGDLIHIMGYKYIIDNFNDGFFLQHHQYLNRQYIKGDCFRLMGCVDDYYLNGLHLEAGVCGFIKTDKTLQFVSEWLECCKNIDIIGDGNKHGDDYTGFIDHRHDQSILSLLALKGGIKTSDIRNSEAHIKYNYYR